MYLCIIIRWTLEKQIVKLKLWITILYFFQKNFHLKHHLIRDWLYLIMSRIYILKLIFDERYLNNFNFISPILLLLLYRYLLTVNIANWSTKSSVDRNYLHISRIVINSSLCESIILSLILKYRQCKILFGHTFETTLSCAPVYVSS